MAIVGPISSVILAFIFFGFKMSVEGQGNVTPIAAVLGYLGYINLILAGFLREP